jgi:ribosomal protein L31
VSSFRSMRVRVQLLIEEGTTSSDAMDFVCEGGRLINIMMTKVNHTGKVYHMRAKRQMAQSLGQVAKFKRRYEQEAEENKDK